MTTTTKPAPTTAPRILDTTFEPEICAMGMYMLEFRYLLWHPSGRRETPGEMFRRVAKNLAEAERRFRPEISDEEVLGYAESFFRTMTDLRFLPNAPTLLGAGGPSQQLSACYVLPIGDSIDEVFDSLRMTAVIHSKGSGTGFSFSNMRQRGAPIATGGVSTGPVSFMRVFDAETEVIKNGGTGWGANMGVLRCDHPDIREFIAAKSDGRGLQNFNISVGVTREFMDAAAEGREFELRDPRSGEAVATVDAGELLDQMAAEAWSTGDPGLLFLDEIERDNPTPGLGTIEATNPCGEAPLLPFEACWLGGVHVARHLDESTGEISWERLRETCRVAGRLMDNAIEMSRYPLPQIREATHRTRKIGVGVMGFADLLIRMGIPYGSEESVSLARALMSEIRSTLVETSEELAVERGVFPAYDESVFANDVKPRRNATVTANAPNSTIAAIAGCSSGVEPLFSLSFEKLLANGDRLRQVSDDFLGAAKASEWGSEDVVAEVTRRGSVASVEAVPEPVREVFVTAHDVSVSRHVAIQSAFQEATDLAVAKTVNLPNGASAEDVRAAFFEAYRARCKGVTCYRDGCRDRAFLESADDRAPSDHVCEGPSCPTC